MRVRLAICLGLTALLVGCGQSSAEPFRAQVHVTPVGKTRIAWYERGQGPPLVMLIGTGSTMAEWDPALLRLLARNRRLILFDYPGVGRSGPWRGRSFDSLADATAGLMEAIHLPRADVLGWSMGGFVAQRLAINHPARVSRLILAGTNPGGSRAVLGTRKAQEIDSEPHPTEADILRELYPPDRQAEARRFLRRLETASQSGEIPDDFHVPAATTRRQVAAEDPWLRSDRNYRQLSTIAVPTLAAAGARDPVVPPINLRRIAARISGAKVEGLPRRPRIPLPGTPPVHPGSRPLPQEPNQRARRVEPNCSFLATCSVEGALKLPVREGPERKSMSTLPTRPLPNSM
jgi:pimeloyl-ACP methyl ester carboxylesterase